MQLLLKDLQAEFECSGDTLGPEEGEVRELKFLGRTITYTADGIEWEGDAKHVEAFLQKMELAQAAFGTTPGCKGAGHHGGPDVGITAGGRKTRNVAATPGVKSETEDFNLRTPMSSEEAIDHRGLVALLNYMSQDRPDTSFASKEAAKTMSSLAREDLQQLKRVARYLTGHRRCALVYRWQSRVEMVDVFTDSDWGGDVRTHKSTSGGCVMSGTHLLLHWSRTQQTVALSSAEAELNAMCKGGQEGIAATVMIEEIDRKLKLRIRTDASAAVGVIQRQGAGRVKHLQIKQLWLQEKSRNGDVQMMKIPRAVNFSDLLTHHWSEKEGKAHLEGMNAAIRGDRSHGLPEGGSQNNQHM